MSAKARGESFVIREGTDRPDQPIQFMTFILGMASTALIHLGQAPNPETQKVEANLALARESLDLLSLLREKTRGNLTPDEERAFDDVLSDLRFRFVEASKR